MDSIESILRHIEGGLVLDVATHQGHFVRMLAEFLSSYQQIVAIDIDEKSIREAAIDLAIKKKSLHGNGCRTLGF